VSRNRSPESQAIARYPPLAIRQKSAMNQAQSLRMIAAIASGTPTPSNGPAQRVTSGCGSGECKLYGIRQGARSKSVKVAPHAMPPAMWPHSCVNVITVHDAARSVTNIAMRRITGCDRSGGDGLHSDNVSDHQVAAPDDLATTNRGHRHSGASVGYLSFVFRGRSVPAPDRTMISQAFGDRQSSVCLNTILV